MFSSEFRFKMVLVVSAISLLSACATKPRLTKIDEVKKANNQPSQTDNTGAKSTELKKVEVVDPMANIQINNEIRQVYKNASNLVKARRYSQAISELIKLKGKYPQLSGTNYQLARIYLLQKNYDKALAQVDESIFKNGRNYYAMNLKGVILKSTGKFKLAKESYLSAIEIYPPYSKSHLNLGVLADLYLGELDLALKEYKTYMKLTSNQDKTVKNWVIEVERRIKAK